LPFTIAISIGFTGPICTALLAYFILKDKLTIGQWIAIFTGYLGVLLMVRPQGQINYAIYIAIIGNIITGLSLIYTKKLSQIDSTNTIIIIGNIGVVFFAALWTLFCWIATKQEDTLLHAMWIMPSWKDLQLLMVMGLLGTVSQLFSLTALKYASPSFLSLFEYTRLILAVPISIMLGEALPGRQQIIGIVIIVASTIYSVLQGNSQTKPKE
jgi:drug/metabolite transporter (DMT)-like permease